MSEAFEDAMDLDDELGRIECLTRAAGMAARSGPCSPQETEALTAFIFEIEMALVDVRERLRPERDAASAELVAEYFGGLDPKADAAAIAADILRAAEERARNDGEAPETD